MGQRAHAVTLLQQDHKVNLSQLQSLSFPFIQNNGEQLCATVLEHTVVHMFILLYLRSPHSFVCYICSLALNTMLFGHKPN